jgi:NADH-quinone oxidoreductase subunit L
LAKASYNKFYIDELYDAIIVRPLRGLGQFFFKIFDLQIIDGIVNSVNKGVTGSSRSLRFMQSGYVGFYIFAMVFGIIAILLFNLIL